MVKNFLAPMLGWLSFLIVASPGDAHAQAASASARSCLQTGYGAANAQTSARPIVIRNQCDRPIQVTFRWQGEVQGRPGVSAPCGGNPEQVVILANSSHRSIETNCSSYAIEATFKESSTATSAAPSQLTTFKSMTGNWTGVTKCPGVPTDDVYSLQEADGVISGTKTAKFRHNGQSATVPFKATRTATGFTRGGKEYTRVNDDKYTGATCGAGDTEMWR